MSLAALVDDAMRCLADEHPEAHCAFRSRLRSHVQIDVGQERVVVAADAAESSRIHVSADLDTLAAMLLGEIEVVDALRRRRFEVTATAPDIAALADALLLFIEGLSRCISSQRLLERLMKLREGEPR